MERIGTPNPEADGATPTPTPTPTAEKLPCQTSDWARILRCDSWTKTSCPCCFSDKVEPLVFIQLAENIQPTTKRWIVSRIEAPERDGGAQLLAHPGEDDDSNMVVVSAPRCTLLRITEYLGLCKCYKDGNMASFSYQDRHSFRNVDDIQEFLTVAEQQYMIKYALDSLRAKKDRSIPGVPESRGVLYARESIFQKLEKVGVIQAVLPLHDQKKLDRLAGSWYSEKQLWGQPLDSIRAYFGDTVAFYFSFLDFYTWALVPPALLGVALTLFLPATAEEGQGGEGSSLSALMVQAVFSMLWSTLLMELWKRRSSTLSYRWGSLSLAERFAEPRPGYRGPLELNAVTGRMEPHFPDWQRQLRLALGSVPVVMLFLCMVALGMAGFYYCEALVQHLHKLHGSLLTSPLLYLPSVLHVLYSNVLGNVYRSVALKLTEWENHREESSFQNHHTAKVLLFSFFNCFAVLFHVAFIKQDLPLLRKRLASLLIVSQVINQCTEVVIPFLVDRFLCTSEKKLKEDDPTVDRLRAQARLPPFPGLFGEYIELLVQFGYLSLFSCVYPLTALLLLLNNITEIRSDAFKICRLFRKPFSPPVANMGVWQAAFEVLSFVSVMSNCWLLVLSPGVRLFCQENGFSGRNALLFAILVEHILISGKMILAFVIPDEPDWIAARREEIEFRSMQALNQQKM